MRRKFNLHIKKVKEIAKADDFYIINDKTKFNTLESYKVARTNIMYSLPKSDGAKVILVTSSEPGEGKTTTTINLAITFAQTGAKVLIIDCDMRKPRIHRYLKVERANGISNVLCGFKQLDEVIIKGVSSQVTDNLDVIAAGEIPPNPAELLASDEMKKVMEKLSKEYDYIFMDTPPVTVVTDAMVIAPIVTGVLCVAKQDVSSFENYDVAINILKQANVKILGFIFNCSEKGSAKYKYYGKKYKYSGKYNYSYRYFDKDADIKEQ